MLVFLRSRLYRRQFRTWSPLQLQPPVGRRILLDRCYHLLHRLGLSNDVPHAFLHKALLHKAVDHPQKRIKESVDVEDDDRLVMHADLALSLFVSSRPSTNGNGGLETEKEKRKKKRKKKKSKKETPTKVMISASSSSVPNPPGKATKASLSMAMRAFRSCIVSHSVLRPQSSPSRWISALTRIPCTSPPSWCSVFAQAPIKPLVPPP